MDEAIYLVSLETLVEVYSGRLHEHMDFINRLSLFQFLRELYVLPDGDPSPNYPSGTVRSVISQSFK